mmetsp:Transcript_13820/g.18156  ORF Transcript_13820/g.18156 Transcript_13820/m.18156 type:complete len:102 (-) Transcript_13820:332-637(-)
MLLLVDVFNGARLYALFFAVFGGGAVADREMPCVAESWDVSRDELGWYDLCFGLEFGRFGGDMDLCCDGISVFGRTNPLLDVISLVQSSFTSGDAISLSAR